MNVQQKSRWKRFKQMNKRRANLYFLEQRVEKLEAHQELLQLQAENAADYAILAMAKVNRLEYEKNSEQAVKNELAPVIGKPRKPSFIQQLWQMLNSKGEP